MIMNEHEKLDRLFGQNDNLSKCIYCEYNLEIKCGKGHYDEFKNLNSLEFCSDFKFRQEEEEEEEPVNGFLMKDCPICGEDAVWDPVLHKYICKNDDCGYEFS